MGLHFPINQTVAFLYLGHCRLSVHSMHSLDKCSLDQFKSRLQAPPPVQGRKRHIQELNRGVISV